MGRISALCFWCFVLLPLFRSSISENFYRAGEVPQLLLPHKSLYDSLHTDFSDYIWPTDAGRLITSIFAEYRSTHFHGGIDISTGDDTGFRVFASRDGYVARIVVSPTGYGKMLWLRHADGFYTTYSHLRNFTDVLDAFVAREQQRLERYPVDIECAPADFPVRKGDVIAFSGETGTGSPHLHFEIRDENKNFVNPLLSNQFTFPDDLPPRFYLMAVTPIGEFSAVNGSFTSRIINFTNPVQGVTALRETLYATGSIGIAVDARDRINNSRFNSGVYRQRLFLDDSLIYSVQFDRAPSSGDFQVGLYYDFALIAEEGGKIAKLYMNSPNRLPFYQPPEERAGIINTALFPDGPHRFKIVTSDFWQNSSELSGTIVFSNPPKFNVAVSDGALKFEFDEQQPVPQLTFFTTLFSKEGRGRVRWKEEKPSLENSTLRLSGIKGAYDVLKIEARDKFGSRGFPQFFFSQKGSLPAASVELEYHVVGDFVRIVMRTDGAFTSPPAVAVIEGDSSRRVGVVPLEYNLYTATFRPLESFSGKRTVVAECEVNGRLQTEHLEVSLYPILPHVPSTISLYGNSFQIIADSFSVYKPLFLEVTRRAYTGEAHYSLRPRHAVLNRGIRVKVRADAQQPQQALYFRRRNSWVLLSHQREGEYLAGELRRTPVDIALMTDSQPPAISRLTLPVAYAKQPHIISFSVRDNLSGVEYKELKLYIDGKFAIPDIDGEHRRVKHRFAEPLKRGSHTLVIHLKDRVGNTSEVRRTFTVR